MGPTGTGKTTLLNAICCNNYNLQIEGDINFCEQNSNELDQKQLIKTIRYVHQQDAFYEYITPREVVEFAIALSGSNSTAESVLSKIQLQSCADNYIGGITTKGISGGEKKRLSIALALLSNPSILVLDEPTTGLDSQTAEMIIQLLKKQALKYERTVITTLHQPSSQAYKYFDKLVLLAQGHIVYFGHANQTINFFQGLGYSCEKDVNPCEFFLDLLCKISNDEIMRLKFHKPLIQEEESQYSFKSVLSFKSVQEKANQLESKPLYTQFIIVFKREATKSFRNPREYAGRVFVFVCYLIITCLTYTPMPTYDQ